MSEEQKTLSQNQKKNSKWAKLIIVFLLIILFISWAAFTKAGVVPNFLNSGILCPESDGGDFFPPFSRWRPVTPVAKPVIYLYSAQKEDVKVELHYEGRLIADYPEYNRAINGWQVTAYPDGKIINQADKKEYSYLFWEGLPEKKIDWDLSTGFVVKGGDTREFLQKKLSEIGLTPKEYNEFIVYWYPLMQNNKYNLIHFADSQYTDSAPLVITPEPDSILRVFMVYKPLKEKIEIKEQAIKPFVRRGFSVVEWGGTKAE